MEEKIFSFERVSLFVGDDLCPYTTQGLADFSGACEFYDLGERFGVSSGQISQHLSIDAHLLFVQGSNQFGICRTVQSRGGIDTRNP